MNRSILTAVLFFITLASCGQATSPMDCGPDGVDDMAWGGGASPVLSHDEDIADAEEEAVLGNPLGFRPQLSPVQVPVSSVAVRSKLMKRSISDANLYQASSALMDLREDVLEIKPLTPQQRDKFIEEYYLGDHDLEGYTLEQLGIRANDKDFLGKVYTNDIYLYFVLSLCKYSMINPRYIRDNHLRALRDANIRANRGDQKAKYNMWYAYHHGICLDKDQFAVKTFAQGLPETILYVNRPGQIFVHEGQQRIDSKTQFMMEDED